MAGALHRAHDRIGELVDEEPALNGTSTTATVVYFDGTRAGIGHVGDSRAYLYRDGEISQLTHDHTFVQSLIDEGRISEAEARVHPHRNLILKALDGIHEAEPDLFLADLLPGDRLLLCSDGASGVLDDARLADVLSSGTPDYAAVELVRASLEAGSSDNVTCIVADVLDEAAAADRAGDLDDLEPLLVGAAAELRRRPTKGARPGGIFRGHRSGDTGELEPVPADVPDLPPDLPADVHAIPSDPLVDPETARYAPRAPSRFWWLRRAMLVLIALGVVWMIAAAAWSWSQAQYYVGEQDGQVVIFRGLDASLPGIELSEPFATTNVEIDRLPAFVAEGVLDGIAADDFADAESIVENLAGEMAPAESLAPAGQAVPGTMALAIAGGMR